MSNKTMIALSTVLVLGTASAAFANDDPENKIGDRYPFLATVAQQRAPASAATEFSGVRRRAHPVGVAEKNWFDRASDVSSAY